MQSMRTRILESVRAMYDRNRQRGVAKWCEDFEYDFVCPSMGTYPFQWLWDSCFHAIVLSHLDIKRAEAELMSLLKNQQPDGFISHVTFWQREKYEALLSTYGIAYRTPYLSDCMQPPLLAEAIDAVMLRGGSRGFLDAVLPKVRRFYDWLDRVRDPDRDGLIATLQPDESGLDHTPKYDAYAEVARVDLPSFDASWKRIASANDAAGRDPARMFEADVFVVEDVLVNTIYAENQRVLSRLLERCGDRDGALEMERRAYKTRSALLEKCWDPRDRLFYDLAGREERMLKTSTISSLMPLLIADLPSDMTGALLEAVRDPERYGAEYPLPTVAMCEPSFEPGICGTKLVWRGPTWINTNWYIARGLRRHGELELADRLATASVDLVERSGFREYYDPHTGEGHGADGFGWSALVLDMIPSQE